MCGLREKQGQCIRAVTDIMFRWFVGAGNECEYGTELPFNVSLQSNVLLNKKELCFWLVSFFHKSSELSLASYSPTKAEARLSS